MTERSVTHASFSIDRNYPVAPERVYHAFADPAAKAKWFAGPDDDAPLEVAMDFREGGREINAGRIHGGPVHKFECLYQDIVPNERIVYTYTMHLDDIRISVSVATIEISPDGTGTKLTITEQGAFLDGYDTSDSRETGTRALLDALGASLLDD